MNIKQITFLCAILVLNTVSFSNSNEKHKEPCENNVSLIVNSGESFLTLFNERITSKLLLDHGKYFRKVFAKILFDMEPDNVNKKTIELFANILDQPNEKQVSLFPELKVTKSENLYVGAQKIIDSLRTADFMYAPVARPGERIPLDLANLKQIDEELFADFVNPKLWQRGEHVVPKAKAEPEQTWKDSKGYDDNDDEEFSDDDDETESWKRVEVESDDPFAFDPAISLNKLRNNLPNLPFFKNVNDKKDLFYLGRLYKVNNDITELQYDLRQAQNANTKKTELRERYESLKKQSDEIVFYFNIKKLKSFSINLYEWTSSFLNNSHDYLQNCKLMGKF